MKRYAFRRDSPPYHIYKATPRDEYEYLHIRKVSNLAGRETKKKKKKFPQLEIFRNDHRSTIVSPPFIEGSIEFLIVRQEANVVRFEAVG